MINAYNCYHYHLLGIFITTRAALPWVFGKGDAPSESQSRGSRLQSRSCESRTKELVSLVSDASEIKTSRDVAPDGSMSPPENPCDAQPLARHRDASAKPFTTSVLFCAPPSKNT